MWSSLFGSQNCIYIHTDKQQYYAGELVTGNISVSVVQPIHVDGVFLKIKGYTEVELEYTEMVPDEQRQVSQYRDANNSAQSTQQVQMKAVTRRAYEQDCFMKRKYTVHSYQCTLGSGNFQFPFQFLLDAKLPGTFELARGSGSSGGKYKPLRATVHYEVEAEIAVPGMFNPNLRHSQEILVYQPLDRALVSSEAYKEANVTFLCCISKGTVSMAANIDRNAYAPGETVQLRLIVDSSQCRVNLEAASLKLQRSLTIHAQGHTMTETVTVAKTRSPPIALGERCDRQIALQLPMRTEPSTHGHLVTCEYQLVVELSVPWSPNVTVKTPVQVFVPQRPTFIGVPQMPVGWAPVVMPMVQLQGVQYTTFS